MSPGAAIGATVGEEGEREGGRGEKGREGKGRQGEGAF